MAVNKLDITMMEDVGTSASQLLQRDGSGNIPAIDGSQVTGLSEFTTSTSDPAIDTNPAGGVGTLWYNKTSGTMYVCTTATAGENVWTNVGAGTGNVQPFYFQGSNYGFSYGGYNHPSAARTNQVDRTSFTSDGNATDVGDMSIGRDTWSGHSSATYGYACGGYSPTLLNTIDRISFAAMGTMTDVGNLTSIRRWPGGVSSETYGYVCGGSPALNIIERFQMVTSANAVDVGDLDTACSSPAGHSDTANSYGYCSAGYGGGHLNVIQRFAMASSGNSYDVGDLTVTWSERAGNSSITDGYTTGKGETSTSSNAIDKFTFAASSNSTDIGDMTYQHHEACGCSSTSHGYTMGGGVVGGAYSGQMSDHIEKFAFGSSTTGTDIGNLTAPIGYLGQNGSQY